jgi:hypothetical protein
MPTGSAPRSADSGEPALEVAAELTSDQAAAALEVVARAAQDDGVRPVSEHVMLHLRYGGEPGSRTWTCPMPAPTAARRAAR